MITGLYAAPGMTGDGGGGGSSGGQGGADGGTLGTGGEGGVGGDEGGLGGGSTTARMPQSLQSEAKAQETNSDPGPPSSQSPSAE